MIYFDLVATLNLLESQAKILKLIEELKNFDNLMTLNVSYLL